MIAKDYKRRPDIRRILNTFARWVDPSDRLGLEIGPLDKPLIDRSQHAVKYVDYFDQQTLAKKIQANPNRDATRLVKLDYVLNGATLSQAIGEKFDYVVASHVLEHVPNLIGWLNELERILNPGGLLFAVIPDCRYTFDIDRPATSLGELVESHIENRETPPPRHVFDQVYYHKRVAAAKLWRNYRAHRDRTERSNDPRKALAALHRAAKRYVDCHCNLFEPDTFAESIQVTRDLGLHRFSLVKLRPTDKKFLDFMALLRAGD